MARRLEVFDRPLSMEGGRKLARAERRDRRLHPLALRPRAQPKTGFATDPPIRTSTHHPVNVA